MTCPALAIFVKTAAFSDVKTRLWPKLGRDRAEVFHRAAAVAVAEIVMQAESSNWVCPYWAVAESEAMSESHWPGFPRIEQVQGSLGARMHNVHETLQQQHGAAILIGADAPQLSVQYLASASQWLDSEHPRMVIGPATDGGFWLFGANRALPSSAWTNVVYSAADTADQFLQQMRAHGALLRLETLTDVDHIEDLPVLSDALAALAHPSSAQSALHELIQDWGYAQDSSR